MSLPSVPSFSTEQLQHMGEQLQSLTRRVEQLEVQAGVQALSPAVDPAFQASLAKAAQFAQDVFRCPTKVSQDFDPEAPGTWWFDIWVESDAPHEELMALRQQWYERIAGLALEDPTTIRLIVV